MEQKLVLVGDGNVGKTTLVHKLFTGEYKQTYIPTLGVEVLPIDNYIMWDTAGQAKFGGLADGYYLNANLALIVVDATSIKTAQNLYKWYASLKRVVPNVKVGVVVNKIELGITSNAEAVVNAFCIENDLNCKTISCKTLDKEDFLDFLDEVNM